MNTPCSSLIGSPPLITDHMNQERVRQLPEASQVCDHRIQPFPSAKKGRRCTWSEALHPVHRTEVHAVNPRGTRSLPPRTRAGAGPRWRRPASVSGQSGHSEPARQTIDQPGDSGSERAWRSPGRGRRASTLTHAISPRQAEGPGRYRRTSTQTSTSNPPARGERERLHIPLPDHYSRVAGLRERDHLFRAVYTRHVEPLLPELSQVMPGATSTRPAASGLPLAPAEAPP